MKKTGLLVVTALLGGLIAVGAYKLFEGEVPISVQNEQNARYANYQMTGSADGLPDFTAAAAVATPTVVHIKTTYEHPSVQGGGRSFDPFGDFFGGEGFDDFFGHRQYRGPAMGSGSGVIITQDGYIVTNNHVIKEADKIEVVLNDKRSYPAKVIGKDPNTDLALLKIEEKGLPFLSYGNSDNVKVGEWVLAVGNPFNLTSTVTAGIVSAKGRNINIIGNGDPRVKFPIESFIQTDAAVNPGNSGGALINTRGELIGINTAIASQTGSYAGYSFAVPVNIAKKVMDDLLEFGAVQRAFLGVTITEVTADLAQEKHIKQLKGIYVQGVSEDGAAESAGIKEGDIITKIASVDVNSVTELQEQIGRHRPGDNVPVTVLREEKEKVINVVLKNEEKTYAVVKRLPSEVMNALGAEFDNLTAAEKKSYRIENGVKISGIHSGKLQQNGIRQGFIVTRIDSKPVSGKEQLEAVLAQKEGDMITVEGFYPQNPNSKYIFSFGIK